MEVVGEMPEATQRPSVEADTPPPIQKPEEIERRPAPAMFGRLFTAVSEITQRALSKARHMFDRQQANEPDLAPPLTEPEPAKKNIHVSRPPQLPEPATPELTPREKQDQAIRDRIAKEQKNRPRMTADQLRAQLDRQKAQGRDHGGPEINNWSCDRTVLRN